MKRDRPPNRSPRPSGGQSVHAGASIYEDVLACGGGRQLKSTSVGRKEEMFVALYEAPPYDLAIDPIDIPRLSINLVSAPVRGRMGSDRMAVYSGRRYSVFFTPAGIEAQWSKARPTRHFNLYFPETELDGWGWKAIGGLRHTLPVLNAQVPRLRPLIDAIEFAIMHPQPHSDEVAVGLAHLIVANLARAEGGRVGLGLSGRTLARVRDHVAIHLSSKIKVADLAAIAGLSVTHFAACFYAAMGCTPHQFVLRERVDAAIRLLIKTRMTLASIAVDCGFSSQQHMSTAVKHRTGVAPKQIRSEDKVAPPPPEHLRAHESRRAETTESDLMPDKHERGGR